MRILFLTQVLPYPLDAGPKTRAYYVLRHLASASHEITLLSFTRTSDRAEHIQHLRTLCHDVQTVPMQRSRLKDGRRLVRSLASDTPFLIARDREPAMVAAIRSLCAAHLFDAVHADQLWMAPYAQEASCKLQVVGSKGQGFDVSSAVRQSLPKSEQTKGIMTVLDQHNAVFQIPKRLAESEGNPVKRGLLALEARKMAAYEARICQQFDHVVWVTAEDRQALMDIWNDRKDEPRMEEVAPRSDPIIPICVDPVAQSPIEPANRPRRVTFLGGLHWPPNAAGMVWFLDEVWPQVVARHPDATLTIIGKDPPAALQHAEDGGRNVDVTGYVDDPRPYLAETAAFIVPLHAGGGMRVKILDAWQWGLPVVSTSIGAEGIQVRDGENLLLAGSAADFAAAVTRVLDDPALAEQLRCGGHSTVEAEYDWRVIYQAWNDIYTP